MSLPLPDSITAATSDVYPFDIMTPATIAVETAIPVTFPEFLDKFTNADTTPCSFPDAAEKIPALLAGRKIPDPELNTRMAVTTYQTDVSWPIKAIM